jgi:GNAT superfamily N-acetyltransferase
VTELPIPLAGAVEVVVRGLAHVRSMTYPCAVSDDADVWMLRDEPDRETARAAELTAIEPTVEQIGVRVATAAPALRRWSLCYLEPADPAAPRGKPPAPPAFRDAGYRRRRIEPLFVADPAQAPRFDGPVERVRSPKQAEHVRLANRGRRQLLPDDLDTDDAATRLYAARDGRDVVGWVSSVRVGLLGASIVNLFVDASARHRGLGRALMSAALADDARLGVRASVLTASADGARLYPHLGYRQVATLHLLDLPRT